MFTCTYVTQKVEKLIFMYLGNRKYPVENITNLSHRTQIKSEYEVCSAMGK